MLPSISNLINQYGGGIRNASIVTIHPGQARRMDPHLAIEVRVSDDGQLTNTYAALEWLLTRGLRDEEDWDIDMRGGLYGYSSFYFRDQQLATEFTLVFG